MAISIFTAYNGFELAIDGIGIEYGFSQSGWSEDQWTATSTEGGLGRCSSEISDTYIANIDCSEWPFGDTGMVQIWEADSSMNGIYSQPGITTTNSTLITSDYPVRSTIPLYIFITAACDATDSTCYSSQITSLPTVTEQTSQKSIAFMGQVRLSGQAVFVDSLNLTTHVYSDIPMVYEISASREAPPLEPFTSTNYVYVNLVPESPILFGIGVVGDFPSGGTIVNNSWSTLTCGADGSINITGNCFLVDTTTNTTMNTTSFGNVEVRSDVADASDDIVIVMSGVRFPTSSDLENATFIGGTLYTTGSQQLGTAIVIDNNRTLKFTAGYHDAVDDEGCIESGANLAVISISLPDARVPLDGEDHEVAGFVYTSGGLIALFIDGMLIDHAEVTGAMMGNSSTPVYRSEVIGAYGTCFNSDLHCAGANQPACATWPGSSSGIETLRIWKWDQTMAPLGSKSFLKTVSEFAPFEVTCFIYMNNPYVFKYSWREDDNGISEGSSDGIKYYFKASNSSSGVRSISKPYALGNRDVGTSTRKISITENDYGNSFTNYLSLDLDVQMLPPKRCDDPTYIYIYTYIHTYIHTYIYIYVLMHKHLYVYTNLCI